MWKGINSFLVESVVSFLSSVPDFSIALGRWIGIPIPPCCLSSSGPLIADPALLRTDVCSTMEKGTALWERLCGRRDHWGKMSGELGEKRVSSH